jgi:hypothetical protein
MADNQIEIDVVLNSEDAVEGFETLGETSSAIAERFSKDNSKLGEGLGQLTGNVTAVVGSVKGLGAVFTTTGTAGKTAWLSMLGPIAAVVAAGYALYETYLLISGAAEEAERSEEAMTAAAGDLQSKLEALAEKGIIPTAKELNAFTIATIEAQYAKERLQQAMEKGVTPAVDKYHKALTKLTNLQKKSRDGTERTLAQNQELGRSIMRHQQALTRQREALRAQFAEYKEEQIEELRMIAQSAKSEQEFEERSNEARLARIKENKTKLDSLLLMDKQTGASEQAAKVYEVEQKELRALFDLELERNKEKSKYLAKQDAELQTLLEAIPQEVLITAAANKAIADVKEEGRKKEAAEQAKAQAAATARAAKYRAIRKAKEVKLQNELKAIRALELERFAIDGKSELEILELRYNDELKLAKKNSNLKTIALMRYENSKTRIENEKEQERIQNQLEANQVRLDQETALAEQRQSFIESTMAFDAQRIEDQTTKELTLLDIRYQKEIGMAEYTQEQITELQRRYSIERQEIEKQSIDRQSIERQEIEKQSIDRQLEKVGEFTNQYGAGLAEAAYSSLLFGESFSESVGEILVALGRQASVQSLMEVAKGTAALFLNPAASGNHFAAAGLFAGAAAAAGVAGKSLGGGGSASTGGAIATSPTGTIQTAPSPQREEAETSSMVFNINFGGAVIYDTQRAAEQAMADRITTLQNTRRRGAPRRSF